MTVWARPSPTLPFCAVLRSPEPGGRGSVVTHCLGQWEPSASDELLWDRDVRREERCGACHRAIIGAARDVALLKDLRASIGGVRARNPLDEFVPILAEPEEPEPREDETPADEVEIEVVGGGG